MHNSVACFDIGLCHRVAVDTYLIAPCGEHHQTALRSSPDTCSYQVSSRIAVEQQVVEKHILQGCFIRQQSVQRTCRQLIKGCIGRCKQCQRACCAEVIQQSGSIGSLQQRREIRQLPSQVCNRIGGDCWRRGCCCGHRSSLCLFIHSRRQQNLVDDMNHAVAGQDIAGGHMSPVDSHTAVDRKGQRFALQRRCIHAIYDITRQHLSCQDMVLQDSGECCWVRQQRIQLPFRQCSECFFARGKHGKGTFCAQRVDQVGCFQGAHQRGELARFYSGLHDVQGGCAFLSSLFCGSNFSWRQQHLVDHMHDAVRSNDIWSNDCGVVDGDRIVGDSDRNGSSLDRHQLTCSQIGGSQRLIADHMIEQHRRQLFFVCQQSLQRVCRQCGKSLVGRRKDGERALSSQGFVQATGCQCFCQRAKVFPIHHNPTYCSLVSSYLK